MGKCIKCGIEIPEEETLCENCKLDNKTNSVETDNIEPVIVKPKNSSKKKIVIICIIILLLLTCGMYILIQSIRVSDYISGCSTAKMIDSKPSDAKLNITFSTSLFENNQKLSDKTWFSVCVNKKTDFLFQPVYKVSDNLVITASPELELNTGEIYYIKFNKAAKYSGTWIVDYDVICTESNWEKIIEKETKPSENNDKSDEISTIEKAPQPDNSIKKSINDIYKEIKDNYISDESTAVYLDSTEKEIMIIYYFNGAKNVADRSITGSNFSWDAWELWSDMKRNNKNLTEAYRDEFLISNDIHDYSISTYILNDQIHNSPNISGEFSYLMHCSNGYCLFDAAD